MPGSSSNPNIVDTTITDTVATATSADILSGKKAYVNGQLVEGNIAKKTSSNVTVSGNTVTIPAGYYASAVTKTVSGSGGGNYSSGDIVLGPTVSFKLTNIGKNSDYYSNVGFQRSSSISKSGSSFVLSNPGSSTYYIDGTGTESDCDAMKGFYVKFGTPSGSMTTAPTEIYFVPTDA